MSTNVDALKKLITKFGGDCTGVETIEEGLNRLCSCEIGGGGIFEIHPISYGEVEVLVENEKYNKYSTNITLDKTYEEITNAIERGFNPVIIETVGDESYSETFIHRFVRIENEKYWFDCIRMGNAHVGTEFDLVVSEYVVIPESDGSPEMVISYYGEFFYK